MADLHAVPVNSGAVHPELYTIVAWDIRYPGHIACRTNESCKPVVVLAAECAAENLMQEATGSPYRFALAKVTILETDPHDVPDQEWDSDSVHP